MLGDRVGELVTEHVDGLGEAVEDLAVTVPEHQLGAVPEGVHVVAAVVDGERDVGAGTVVRRAVEHLGVEPEGPDDPVRGLVDGSVAGRRVTDAAHLGAGQGRGVLRRVDRPAGTVAAAPVVGAMVGCGWGMAGRWSRSWASTVSVAVIRAAAAESARAICSRRYGGMKEQVMGPAYPAGPTERRAQRRPARLPFISCTCGCPVSGRSRPRPIRSRTAAATSCTEMWCGPPSRGWPPCAAPPGSRPPRRTPRPCGAARRGRGRSR